VNAEAHHNGIISFDIAILRHKENCFSTQFFSTLPAEPLKAPFPRARSQHPAKDHHGPHQHSGEYENNEDHGYQKALCPSGHDSHLTPSALLAQRSCYSFGLRRHDAAHVQRGGIAQTGHASASTKLKSPSMISSGFRNFERSVGSGLNVSAGSRDNFASSDTTLSLWTFMSKQLLLLANDPSNANGEV
jgi:hypothetical protein